MKENGGFDAPKTLVLRFFIAFSRPNALIIANMNKIKNPILFFTLTLSAFLILALASYSLSSAAVI